MHTRLLAASIALVSWSAPFAATAAETSDPALTGNATFVSDYVFRGITQAWDRPAFQGTADLTFANGLAFGVFASSISQKSFPGAAAEIDLYGSYGANFNDAWSWRAGFIAYLYPGGNLDEARPSLDSRAFNTVEANFALSWTWLTFKLNYALTDYFAIDTEQGYRGDSKGTTYLQVDAALPLAQDWSLALHAGHTYLPTSLITPLPGGAHDPDYSDYGATLKWMFHPHWSASLGLTFADNNAFYGHTASFRNPADLRDVAGTRAFLQLQAAF
jgi:uncharacterized protein (TIGR02001 family)